MCVCIGGGVGGCALWEFCILNGPDLLFSTSQMQIVSRGVVMWWSHYNTWLICKLVFGALEGVRPQYLTSLWPLWGGMLVLENSLISLKNVKEKRQGRTRKHCFPQASPTSPETSFHPEDGADSGLSCYCWHEPSVTDSSRPMRTLAHDMNIASGLSLLFWELLLTAFFFTSWINSKSIHPVSGLSQSRGVPIFSLWARASKQAKMPIKDLAWEQDVQDVLSRSEFRSTVRKDNKSYQAEPLGRTMVFVKKHYS